MIFISCLILYPIFVELLLYYYIIRIIYLHIDDDSRNEQNLCHDSLHHNSSHERIFVRIVLKREKSSSFRYSTRRLY